MSSIIIIGAGAAGLTVARKLAEAGKQVTVLEARDRTGGRIHTTVEKPFTTPIENGAEFIHGDLPRTQRLAREANVSLREGLGKQWNVNAGRRQEGDFFDPQWSEMIDKLNELKQDINIASFLEQNFPGPAYQDLREGVTQFVQGFDAADTNKASAFALREEWTSNDATKGYHLVEGYSQLMNHLVSQCTKAGVVIHLSTIVNDIFWTKGKVAVVSTGNERYEADQILVTIPPAVLRSGSVKFYPPVVSHQKAIEKIETGGVIKILVEFSEAFWEDPKHVEYRQFPDAQFVFSDAYIPTWWSQRPSPVPLLTGWLSGPATMNLRKSDEELINEGIKSLSYIFDCDEPVLRKGIVAAKVINWVADPFALGAYAYRTVETPAAVEQLTKPVEDTVYFAGEAYYSGPEMGTVEAALASGETVAEKIISR